MKDFRVIQAKVLLPIHSLTPIRGFLPVSILISGERLDKTKEVFYNGIQAKEFVIQSPTSLLLRVPPSQVGKRLDSLKIVANAYATRSPAEIVLEVAKPIDSVEGIERLIQSWLLVFFTTPGSDIFSKGSGGGVKSILGHPTDRDQKGAAADLALSVEKTKNELMRIQTSSRYISPRERLLSCNLDSVEFDSETTTLVAQVSIQNSLGEVAEISVR